MKILNYTIRKKVLVIAGLFLLLPFSCEKFFEIDIVSQVDKNNVFLTVDYTKQAILGVYQVMTLDEGYSKRLNMFYAPDNDCEMCSGSSLDNGRRDIARYTANSGNAEIEKPWINLYKGINRAAICIENIPSSPVYETGSENEIAEMDRMLGEAYTLRALFYYELIRNWGDVPFWTKSTEAGDEYALPKTNRDTIYDYIIGDLYKAIDLVPWRSELVSEERITKGAVKGLLARIALARGGYSLRKEGGMQRSADYRDFYQIARDQCWDIMESGEHELNPVFENIFRNHCEYVLDSDFGESMWEVGLGQFRSGEVGY